MTAHAPAPRRSKIALGANSYGKARVRLVKVTRSPDRHLLKDLTVQVALEGDFEAAHVAGDNSLVVATDTMKNTVYALAKAHLDGATERYGLALAGHFLTFPQVSRSTVSISEHRWSRISTKQGPAPDAFMRTGDLTRTAVVSASREGSTVDAGIENLTVLKTTRSAFAGFPRDQYTTLADTDDRIMATKVTASWRYEGTDLDFDSSFEAITGTLLEVFAEHFSPSVQYSIWAMGEAALERRPEIAEIRFSLPNLHHWLVDLSRFGLENDKEIYVATEEPYGLIEATVRRG